MKIVNLTPHPVRIGERLVHQNGEPIRVIQHEHTLYTVDGVPVKMILTAQPISTEPLPPVESHTLYIVSRLVADVYKDIREDFVFPYNFVRTRKGRLLGCQSLARFEPNP
jgi:hypothetical protein